jgi:hypothetical protein
MFAGKPSTILLESLKGAPLEWALTLLANIRLSWKIYPRTNTLAYLKQFVIYGHKKFYKMRL